MPDVFDRAGLHVKTKTELVDELNEAYRQIYGDDINLEPNSPDGQLINILAQEGIDIRELLLKINASFDPDQAEGNNLDSRVGINGIQRRGGTFTLVEVEVTVNRALNLVGLDTQSDETDPTVENLYTVRDDAGNQFYLLESQTIGSARTNSFTFRAAEIGDVQVQANTITTPVTTIRGVTEINNPGGATVQGTDEETDAELRSRRRVSTAISAIGNVQGLEGALRNIDGVTIAIVRENNTTTTDGDGTPAHTIWCIVDGGDADTIALAIAQRKTHGAGMRGDVEVDVPYSDGRPFIVKFDRPIAQDLYIRFSITRPGGGVDPDFIKEQIVENIQWQVGADAQGDVITAFLKGLDSDYVITDMEVSDDDSTWAEVVEPTSIQHRFVNATTRITLL